jgi:hypothetical protein
LLPISERLLSSRAARKSHVGGVVLRSSQVCGSSSGNAVDLNGEGVRYLVSSALPRATIPGLSFGSQVRTLSS